MKMNEYLKTFLVTMIVVIVICICFVICAAPLFLCGMTGNAMWLWAYIPIVILGIPFLVVALTWFWDNVDFW